MHQTLALSPSRQFSLLCTCVITCISWWTRVIEPTSDPSRYCLYFRLIKPILKKSATVLIMVFVLRSEQFLLTARKRAVVITEYGTHLWYNFPCLQEAIPVYKGLTSKSRFTDLLQAIVLIRMNAFPEGTRVFFWDAKSQIVYGIVQSTSRMSDGTQILVIKDDTSTIVTLPAAGVTKVA